MLLAPSHGFPMNSLPEFADLETLLGQGNFSADAVLTRRAGSELHILRAPSGPLATSLACRGRASQPAQVVQKKEAAYHLRTSGSVRVINALHFLHDG